MNKLHQFISKQGKIIQNKLHGTTFIESDFYKSISGNDSIPLAIRKLYPTLNEEKLLKRMQDPVFLYESIKICTECYEHFKTILAIIKEVKASGKSQREEIKKPNPLPMIPRSQPTALPRLYKLPN
jgi:hypothetical protein